MRSALVLALLSSLALAPSAAAQETAAADPSGPAPSADPAAEAEAAFARLEYERSSELAQQAIEAGGARPSETARLYELIGTGNAFLGGADASRAAYQRALAIQPDMSLDTSLPPALRTPFLEARGWWSARRERLEADLAVGVLEPEPRFRLTLSDPLDMVTSVEIRHRLVGGGAFEETAVAASEFSGGERLGMDLGVTAEQLRENGGLEYQFALRDRHGNVVRQQGTAAAPLALRVARPGASTDSNGVPVEESAITEQWWFWTAIIVGVLAAGAVATGLYFGLPPGGYEGQTRVVFR